MLMAGIAQKSLSLIFIVVPKSIDFWGVWGTEKNIYTCLFQLKSPY